MSRYLLLFCLIVLFGFSSCVKSGPTKACFTFSNSSPKVNDTLYLLNCSEYYSRFTWINPNGFYPSGAVLDTVNRHQRVVVTGTGNYTVTLRVGGTSYFSNSTTGYSEISKTITVSP